MASMYCIFTPFTFVIIILSMMRDAVAETNFPTKTTVSTVRTILTDIDKLQEETEVLKYKSSSSEKIPFVCVTYAQTFDGNIALKFDESREESSSNLKLSSKESFLLTHALRSRFNAILIGGNTLKTDNPRLNNRMWPDNCSLHEHGDRRILQADTIKSTTEKPMHFKQPIPVILDTSLRHIMSMVESNQHIKAAKSHDLIIVCCSQNAYDRHHIRIQDYCSINDFIIELLPCDSTNENDTRGLNLEDVLYKLRVIFEIDSIMVEGGASIISAFLSRKKLVDCVCVTICPRAVGKQGLNALGSANIGGENNAINSVSSMLEFDASSWFLLGPDCILVASLERN